MAHVVLALLLILPMPPQAPSGNPEPPGAPSQITRVANGRPEAFTGLRGTWYCNPPRYPRCTKGYGPSFPGVALTPDLGIPKGTRVEVCRHSRCTYALVIDCSCHGTRHGIDLYASVWKRLGVPLSAGRMTLTIRVDGRGLIVPPPTDVAP